MGHIRRRLTILALAPLLALTACGGGDDVAPTAAAAGEVAYGLVSPDEARALAATPGVTVLDVRTPAEFAEGHIDGATVVDFYEPGFAEAIAALDRDGTYLVYCRSGNRSGQAVALMAQLGFERVYDLDGGVVAWSGAGLPLG
jgi:rhodanese-related sulfurtransferase